MNEPGVLQSRQRLLHQPVAEADDRIPVGGLIARREKGVEREGVLLRRCQLLLDERADHPSLLEVQAHGLIIGPLIVTAAMPHVRDSTNVHSRDRGAGYIGSHTVRLLRERSYDVVVLDSLEFGHPEAVGDVPSSSGTSRTRRS